MGSVFFRTNVQENIICAINSEVIIIIIITSLNPQNLRNIIKKVGKISIIQILISNLSVKRTVFCYFLQVFRYHKFCTFMLVVDKILTHYLMIENTLLFHIRNQYPKVNQKSEYRKICSISILTN